MADVFERLSRADFDQISKHVSNVVKPELARLRERVEAAERRTDPQVGIDVLELKKSVNDAVSRLEDQRAREREEGGRIIDGPSGFGDTPGSRVERKHASLEMLKSVSKVTIPLDGGLGLGNCTPMAAITTTSVGSSTPGILTPDRVNQFVPLARQRLTLRDLLPSRAINSGVAEWVRENTAPSVGVQPAEGSPKAETSQSYSIASAKAVTLAAFIVASSQVLDDWPSLRRIIDNSLLYRLRLEEENRLLSGDGIGENINGLITQAQAYSGSYDSPSDQRADRLRKAILELEEVSEQADFIVLNPLDFALIQLQKSATEGHYIVQSPLGTLSAPVLWGRPVVVTNSIAAGSFLIGDSRMAEILDRMQANVMISTEHEDFFTRNLVAIRVEERVALAVLRTTAFLKGSFGTLSP